MAEEKRKRQMKNSGGFAGAIWFAGWLFTIWYGGKSYWA